MSERARFVLAMAALAILVGAGYQFTADTPTTPCSPGAMPVRCYRISTEMCQTIWQKAEEPCTSYIRGLSLPPGRLIGPFVFKCQSANLDKAFQYSRKSTPECDEMSADLHEWEQRNDLKF